MTIVIGGRSLPVIETADLVVAGASFGGAAMAMAAAEAGLDVVLVEARTYPGYEAAALLRPWIAATALAEPPRLMAPWLGRAASKERWGEVALHPDEMKRGIEDTLLDAGVRLLYTCQVAGVVWEGEGLAGLVVANKSGRQAVIARAIVDATSHGTAARLAGEPFVEGQPLPRRIVARRTLEFTGVDPGVGRQVAVPDVPGIEGGEVVLHPGVLDAGHVFVEALFPLAFERDTFGDLASAEVEARFRSVRLASCLLHGHPGFERAFFAASSWELWLAPLSHLAEGDGPEGTAGMATGEGSVSLPLRAMRGAHHQNLFVVGPAAAFAERAQALAMLDPVAAARVGEALAPGVVRAVERASRPDPVNCEAICGERIPDAGEGGVVVREPDHFSPGLGCERVAAPAAGVGLLGEMDVLVVGGGTSGAVAAPVAAEEGMRTGLIEMNSGLGGTQTLGGVNTYWYGRRVAFTAEADRRYLAEAARLRASDEQVNALDRMPDSGFFHVEARMHAFLRWSVEAGVAVFFRSIAVGALVEGERVCGAIVATPFGLMAIRCRALVEATGDGDVAAFAGAETAYGSARDHVPMWYSLGPLPEPGRPTNSFATPVDVTDVRDVTRAILAGRRRFTGYDHGPYVAPRESRHVLGGWVVNLGDQLAGRAFRDVVNVCYSGIDIKGLASADWALWGHARDHFEVEIPYRALIPRRLDGVIVAGKAFSCTHEGLGLPRMQPDLQNLGGVCALSAARAIRMGRELRDIDVPGLQGELVERGLLSPGVLERREEWAPPDVAEAERLVEALRGDEVDGEYGEPDAARKARVTAGICAAGPRVVPALAAAHAAAEGKRRLLLARLLAWHGSQESVPTLLGEIERQLGGDALPALPPITRWRHLPPDNAHMAPVLRLVYSLALTRQPQTVDVLARIVDLIPEGTDYGEAENGYCYYVHLVCLAAEYLGLPDAVPVLQRLHAKRELHGLAAGSSFQRDVLAERMGYLEVAIGRALARCGSPDGVRTLVGYLEDARAYLAGHARDELVAVAGRDLGREPAAWLEWLAEQGETLEPRPWTGRSE